MGCIVLLFVQTSHKWDILLRPSYLSGVQENATNLLHRAGIIYIYIYTTKALSLTVHVYMIHVPCVPHVSGLPCCLFCNTSGTMESCCQFCHAIVCTDCLTQSPKEKSKDVKSNDSRKQKTSRFNLILLLESGWIGADIWTRSALFTAQVWSPCKIVS
jgi:hypothetical protein